MVSSDTQQAEKLSTRTPYGVLASLRHAMRRFLMVSEQNAQRAGLPPQQYNALLGIKVGYPGREAITIRELADHLQIRHHSAVELADRLEAADLIVRQTSASNRRHVEVLLTPAGEKFLHELSRDNIEELRLAAPVIAALAAFIDRDWLPQRQRGMLARIRQLAKEVRLGLGQIAPQLSCANVVKFAPPESHADAPEASAPKAPSLTAFSKAFSRW